MCVVFGCETSVHSRVPRVVCTCMHAWDPLVAPLRLPARFVYRAFSARGTGACSAPPPLRNPGGFPTSLLAGVSTPARQGRRWLPPAPPFCVAVALRPLWLQQRCHSYAHHLPARGPPRSRQLLSQSFALRVLMFPLGRLLVWGVVNPHSV